MRKIDRYHFDINGKEGVLTLKNQEKEQEYGDIDAFAYIITRSDLPLDVAIFCTGEKKEKRDFVFTPFNN